MPLIDKAQLIEQIDGDLEMLEIAYEAFCEESVNLQEQLRAAFAASDLAAVRSTAHSINGMVSNFMAAAVCQTTIKIEAIENANTLASKQALLETLSQQIDQMLVELKQMLAAGHDG
jgi:HPt (histidine-containing phosphotransfer) domain-containing protein